MNLRAERSVVLGVAFALALPSLSLARPRCAIDVAIDPVHRIATGRVAIDLENTTGEPLSAIELWRYPARLERPSPALTEIDWHWHYPRGFSPGRMDVRDVAVDGRPVAPAILDDPLAGAGTVLRLPLPEPLPPGARAHVEARFLTEVPHRFGSFGCDGGECTLSGGFYPMLVALGDQGFDRRAPPARADLAVTVRVPAGVEARVAGIPVADGAPLALEDQAWALVTLTRGARESRVVHRGVTISYLHHGPPPPTPGKPLVPGADRTQRVLDQAREAIELLHEMGLDVPAGTALRLVEAPLRTELAEPHAGVVLVSDRIYRITPLERLRKFHSFQLVRAIFAALAEERLAARERVEDLAWSPDVVASWLVDLFTIREYHRAEFAQDLLKWVAFIPTIDLILYAPQVPFASAWFNTLDEPDPTRDDLRRFATDLPRGKTIYEKLRDRLGDRAMAEVGRAMWAGEPVRAAAARVAGAPLEPFFAQWLGPYPAVDYRFELIESRRVGEKWLNRIMVYKRGSNPPVEPVEVRVTEWGGARHELRWDGQGAETVLTVETSRSIRRIELDPRGRLSERLPEANDDLRLDDTSPAPWKFIYNDLGALLNFQTLTLDLALDFTLARVHDVKNSMRFTLFRTVSTQIGASASYARGFGRLVTPARLSGGASIGLTVSRIDGTYGRVGETPLPGTRISLGAAVGYDDRRFAWEPARATAASLGGSWTATILDNGSVLQQVTVAGVVERIQPLAVDHQLAFLAGAAATFGDLLVPSQMLAAGAPSWLRGYEPDELLGRLRAGARVEYRHVFVHDLDWNFFQVLFLRGVGGGLFGEAGVISSCESYAIGGDDVFGDVGYSLRFFADLLGVSQTVLNFDLAVPLVRRAHGCFQDAGTVAVPVSARAPVGFFVYFGPVW